LGARDEGNRMTTSQSSKRSVFAALASSDLVVARAARMRAGHRYSSDRALAIATAGNFNDVVRA
jgi:hypothetical protein